MNNKGKSGQKKRSGTEGKRDKSRILPQSVDSVRGDGPRVGRRLAYQPEELADKFEEFLRWVEENPLKVAKPLSDGSIIDYNVRRPLTLEGFARFAGILSSTFRRYEREESFSAICEGIRDAIRADQLDGAFANLYNPMIAARVLKLRDAQDLTTDGQAIMTAPPPHIIHLSYKERDIIISADDIE